MKKTSNDPQNTTQNKDHLIFSMSSLELYHQEPLIM